MPKKKNQLKKQQLEELKNFTNNTFTEPITHSFQCDALSKHIQKTTGSYISAQTLRRLYGFIKTDFYPSMKTVEVLAVYNGFPNWHTFTEQLDGHPFVPLTLDQEASLYLSFYQIDIRKERDMNYHNATRNVALRILSNTQLLAKLSSPLAANPVSQVYFFERFPYADGLGSPVYKRSLRLYLQKRTTEAQIYGNSLLFLSAFLCNKPNEVNSTYGQLMKYTLSGDIHPFVVARYIGSNILYSKLKNKNPAEWIVQIDYWNQYFRAKEKTDLWRYPYFQHLIACYLNLAGLFAESHAVIRSIELENDEYEIESGYREILEVISSIARHSSYSFDYQKWFIVESDRCFDSIGPLFRYFYQLQALCVYRSLTRGKKKEKTDQKIQKLIERTGFVFFSRYLL